MTALITLLPNLNQLLPQLISQFGSLIYLGLFAMIFIETGVVVLPFLPGDSLLFLCGSLAAMANHSLNIWVLFGLLSVAAVLGDSLNFEIGEHFSLRLAHSAKLSRFIKPAYLERSQRFFDRHGKAAIFLGRFMPIIRTFIPFTAGVTWVAVALGAGYLFGNIAIVKTHFELIMLAIVVISLAPAAFMALRHRGGADDAD